MAKKHAAGVASVRILVEEERAKAGLIRLSEEDIRELKANARKAAGSPSVLRAIRPLVNAAIKTVSISAAQLRMLRAVDKLAKARRIPPSIRELGAELGISSNNGVSDSLRLLERAGLVTREEALARSTVITALGERTLAEMAGGEA